jgi:hypothetical protein
VFVDLDASKCKGMSGEVAYDPVASTPLDVPVVPPVPHPTKAPGKWLHGCQLQVKMNL